MRWLVTGGCGFIGRNLIRTLAGQAVRVVDDLSTGTREELAAAAPDAELLVGDVRDEALARRAAEGADVIVHLAANTGVAPSVADPRRDCAVNILGTLNYLEAARHAGVRRFVLASSGAALGEQEPPLHEALPARPVSPYGASKLAGEAYCSAYAHCFAVEAVALRFANAYGPLSGHKASVVAKLIGEALRGQAWEIHGDGGQTRDFIFVEDVAAAVRLCAVVDGIGGEVFQIATGVETTVADLAGRLRAVLLRHGCPVPEPVAAAVRPGDVRRNYSDTAKARTRLGWQPQVALQDGLERTVTWFLRR